MKSKKALIIFTLAFVFILAGASVLYQKLSKEVKPQGGGLSAQDYNNIVENNEQKNQIEGNTTDTDNGNPGENDTSDSEENSKAKAPDFTVLDSEGNEVHLSDFFGKPIILNFWASWCGPCKSEMADFNETYSELGEEVCFLMVNLTDGSRETAESAKAFIEEQGYTFPVYYDTDSEAAITYGVNSIPATYFIDSEGCLIAQAMGAIDAETLQTGIDMIISK